jgi:hypothetical protein
VKSELAKEDQEDGKKEGKEGCPKETETKACSSSPACCSSSP